MQKIVKNLRTFGEAGVVKVKSKTSPKLKNKALTCAFTSRVDNHDGDCYHMWDPVQHRMHVIRDVIWLKKMCHVKKYEP